MLRWLRGGLVAAVLIASVFIGAVFTSQNTSLVPLDLVVVSMAPRPMAVWLIASFIAGAILAFGFSSWAIAKSNVKRAVAINSRSKP